MKRSLKILLLISALSFVLGGVLIVGTFVAIGFDFSKLDSNKYEQKEQVITEEFSDIEISLFDWDLHVALAEDGVCRLSYYDTERMWFDVTAEDGVLSIKQHDERAGLDFINIFSSGERETVLYLPEKLYGSLRVEGGSSDVSVGAKLSFAKLDVTLGSGDVESLAELREGASIYGSSGDVRVENVSGGTVSLESSSGDITVRSSRPDRLEIKVNSGDIELWDIGGSEIVVESDSGDMEIANCTPSSMRLTAESGDIELSDVIVSGAVCLITSSGDVGFSRIDAAEIEVKVSSGDVEGTLLSGKVFEAEVSSGSVHLPQSDIAGGPCRITTSSGDIDIAYAN